MIDAIGRALALLAALGGLALLYAVGELGPGPDRAPAPDSRTMFR